MRKLALALAILLAAPALADDLVKQFKKDWEAASQAKEGDPRGDAQAAALAKLNGASTAEAAQAVVPIAIDEHVHYKAHEAAMKALASMTADPVRAWVSKALTSDKDVRVRTLLCEVAGAWPDEQKKPALLSVLKDKEPVVLRAAASLLSTLKDKDVVSALIVALKDQARDPRTQDDFVRALSKLTKQNHPDGAAWEAWWAASKESFSFDAAENPPADKPETSGPPRTTSNGSGLYETITSNRVIFVIDVSFSMRITGEVEEKAGSGTTSAPKKRTITRLEYVQKELCAAIDAQLNKKCLFNVIAFSTKVTPWKPKLVEANDANRKAAKAWVAALQPDAETNTYDALEAAFQDKQVDTIYLLTDGFPTHGKFLTMDGIAAEVAKWNSVRRIRINTICYVVGDGKKFSVVENKSMSKNFMKKVAEASGGTYKEFDGD